MICPNCKKEIGQDSKFCKFCGMRNKNNKRFKPRRIMRILFEGRIGRLQYFLVSFILSAVLIGILSIITLLNLHDDVLFLLGVLFMAVLLPITVKRLHDFNMPGYLSIIGFLGLIDGFSVVAIIFNLVLLFYRGDSLVNQYGDVPSLTKRQKIAMWLVLIFALLLAAFLRALLFI